MTEGLAAVQSRVLEIQSRFAPPVVRLSAAAAPSVTPAATPPATGASSSFSSLLASSEADLSAAAGASPSTAGTSGTARSSAPSGSSAAGGVSGESVVAKAKEHLGTPYLWGGESPGGFDCSGLIQWTYKQFGIELPRVSRDQAKAGREVTAAEARPGDLVFFDRPKIDHIGMYAGNGQWVVAPKTGDVVKMQAVDLSKATTIRRILPDQAVPAAPPPTTGADRGPGAFAALFSAAGQRHGVSPALLTAIARAESGFNPAARSPAGAQGLMQFMPATAAGLGIDPWKPAEAVDGAARLLKSHLQRFGSTELALAAYNAGPGAVSKHGGMPPYSETQNYVRKIMSELRAAAA